MLFNKKAFYKETLKCFLIERITKNGFGCVDSQGGHNTTSYVLFLS